jgi:peptidyl-tRNA hydrolase, PTH1 family
LRAVVGLGNPGKRYELTRHNVGFQILDKFAENNKLNFRPSKRDYYYSEGSSESSDFFLVKPTSYMNLSGEAVLDFLDTHPLDIENLLVVVDDVNLQVGQVRLRKSGSDGGHNGIKSIVYNLQSDLFPRLRFGIGSDFEKGEMSQFVLDRFKEEEIKIVSENMNFCVELMKEFISGGYKSMLDFYSRNSNKINAQKEDLSSDQDR